MSSEDTIPIQVRNDSIYQLDFDLTIEEDNVMVTTGLALVDDGCLTLEGTLAFI